MFAFAGFVMFGVVGGERVIISEGMPLGVVLDVVESAEFPFFPALRVESTLGSTSAVCAVVSFGQVAWKRKGSESRVRGDRLSAVFTFLRFLLMSDSACSFASTL